MKKLLRLSDKLALPAAYATSRNMVLGQSESGKSNTCVVLAEEMHRVKIPWVAIDPKGDWYGVRSGGKGKGSGLDVPVFGGEFGDMPLYPRSGVRMAELVAAGKFAGVLDVSDFDKTSDVSQFLIDFGRTLLKKQRTPVHLFLEEAADYLPQGGFRGQLDPMASACVGMMKKLATKCRFRGIGYTVISQRPAEVNKTVLYQCDTLIAHRLVGDLDIEWIAKWVKRSSKRAPELLETVDDLNDGECWVWSPKRLGIIQRVQARRRWTFDSGSTPKIGEARVVPKLAKFEIQALQKELADLEEQAKAEDPSELKKKLAERDRRIRELEKAKPATVVSKGTGLKEGEIAVRRDHLEHIVERVTTFEKQLEEHAAAAMTMEKATRHILIAANGTAAVVRRACSTGSDVPAKRLAKAPPSTRVPDGGFRITRKQIEDHNEAMEALRKKTNGASNGAGAGATIGGGLRRMMIALAQKPGLTNRQLGVRAGLSSRSGTFSTYLSRGRTEGWIEYDGDRRSLTDAGLHALGQWEPLPSGGDLLRYWLGELGGGASRMLEALSEAYPRSLTNEQLGEASGISHRSGTFSTYLSRLRTLELVEGRGEIKLAMELVGP